MADYTPSADFDFTGISGYTPEADFDFNISTELIVTGVSSLGAPGAVAVGRRLARLIGVSALGAPGAVAAAGQLAWLTGIPTAGSPQVVVTQQVAILQSAAALGAPGALASQQAAIIKGHDALGTPQALGHFGFLSRLQAPASLGAPRATIRQTYVAVAVELFDFTEQTFRDLFVEKANKETVTIASTTVLDIIFGALAQTELTAQEALLTTSYTKLRDYMTTQANLAVSSELIETVKEVITQTDGIVFVVPLATTEALLITDTLGINLDKVLRLMEQIRFSTKLTGTGELLLSAQTQARLADAIALRQTSSLAELITLTGAAAAEIYYGALAVEQVLMYTGSSMLGEYSRSLKEFVTLLTANGFVSGVQLAEAVGLLETATPDYKRELSASDQLAISAVQSVLVELTNTLAETWRGADQLQMARVLGLSEQLLVEAAIITGANGKLSEQLGLVERAAATLELVAYLKDTLTASEITAFISALGLAETLTLADIAVHDAVAQLLAREPLALVALVGAVTERGAWLPELVGLNTLAGFRAEFGVVDALSLTDQALLDYLRDWLLKESIGVSDKTTPALELAISLAERVRLLERAAPVLWSKLETGFSLTELAQYSLQYVLKMQEQLRLADVSPVMMELLTGLAEITVFVDYAGTVSFLTAADQFTLADLLKQQLVLGLADQLSLADLDTVAGFFALDLSDNLVWTDKTQSLGELFARAASGLMFFGRMPLQEGDYTAWVFNTDTLGMTQYTNYSFNSMMLSQDRLFGLTETGLYLLEGSTDDGVDIDTLVATGDLDFGVKIRKAVPRAYLYITKPGQLVLRTISYHYGQAQEHFYEITLRAEDVMGVHRLRLRREIRAEAWAFEIKNVNGGDFELQGAEVLPVLLTRRS